MSAPSHTVLGMYHPWRDLRGRGAVALRWSSLPSPLRAVTDGACVWMHDRLSQAERRSVLTHELVHLDAGDETCQPEAVERAVDQEAARRLVALDALVDALLWSQDETEMAEELWVDVPTLVARIEGLTEAERDHVEAALARREEAL